jgi:hypothetical protein
MIAKTKPQVREYAGSQKFSIQIDIGGGKLPPEAKVFPEAWELTTEAGRLAQLLVGAARVTIPGIPFTPSDVNWTQIPPPGGVDISITIGFAGWKVPTSIPEFNLGSVEEVLRTPGVLPATVKRIRINVGPFADQPGREKFTPKSLTIEL